MKLLISINKEFFEVNMKTFFDAINTSEKKVDGIELILDKCSENEKNMAVFIAKKLKEENLEMQIVAPKLMKNVLEQYEYLKFFHQLSLILEEKLKVIYIPYETEKIEDSIYVTTIMLKRLAMHVEDKKYNLELLIQNTENINLDEINKVVKNNNVVKIAYNITRENIENKITKQLESRIDTISFSTPSKDIILKHPFHSSNAELENLFKMLSKIKYDKNIVLSLNLDNIYGSTYKEKIDEYLKESEKIRKYMN